MDVEWTIKLLLQPPNAREKSGRRIKGLRRVGEQCEKVFYLEETRKAVQLIVEEDISSIYQMPGKMPHYVKSSNAKQQAPGTFSWSWRAEQMNNDQTLNLSFTWCTEWDITRMQMLYT